MPSIIIFEDLDKFFSKSKEDVINFDDKKTKILYCLINEIENLQNFSENKSDKKNNTTKILVISSCSNLDKVDTELKKPGNLDYVVDFSPPSQPNRKKLLKYFSQFFSNNITDYDYEILADKSHGFVPTDIIQIFK